MTNPFARPNKLTCQVCEGKFYAIEGYIANHGHKKLPGQISAGCPGSRHRPLENHRYLVGVQINLWKDEVTKRQEKLDWMYLNEDEIAENGFVIDGYEINEYDLDRDDFDSSFMSKEEAQEVYDDMKYHMGRLGFHDFEYGKVSWEQFFEAICQYQGNLVNAAEKQRDLYQRRYDDWVQTISDEQWEHNRQEIMGPKRTKATHDGWETSHEAKTRVRTKSIAASKPKKQKVVTTIASKSAKEPVHPRMFLREYGEIVALFSDSPVGNGKVFEAVPNGSGSWDVIDTHESWEIVKEMFGDKLQPA